MGGIFTDLLLLLYWHPFPTVLVPCLYSTRQLSLATDLKWCNVSGFKLVSLPALLHRSAKHGDMRCLSYETQHEVSSKREKTHTLYRHRFPHTFSPERIWVRTSTKGYNQPTTLVIPIVTHLSCPIISVGRSSVSLRWPVQISSNTRAQF
jgi:hypothetical protein